MTRIAPPAPKYIGPPAHFTEGSNKPILDITIHSTVSDCVPGGAEQIARYFTTQAAGGSAHYVVDPRDVIQAAWDSVICWHSPPNQHRIGIEMCDRPGPVPGDKRGTAAYKAAKRAWRWVGRVLPQAAAAEIPRGPSLLDDGRCSRRLP